jgi:hypothetical protein
MNRKFDRHAWILMTPLLTHPLLLTTRYFAKHPSGRIAAFTVGLTAAAVHGIYLTNMATSEQVAQGRGPSF